MSVHRSPAIRAGTESWIAAGSVALLGSGLFLVFASLFTSNLVIAAVGAGAASVALFGLFASGWVAMLPMAALSFALPPAYASEAIRLGPALLVTILVVGAWAMSRGVNARSIIIGRLPIGAVALFVVWLVVSAGFAVDRGSAMRETANLLLFFTFLVVATDLLMSSPGRVRAIMVILGWTAAAAGGFAVLEMLAVVPGEFPLVGTGYYRATGGFGWPNELAMYLAISLPFSVFLVRDAQSPLRRWLAVLGLLLAVAGLGATFSRGSWIATLVAPAALFLLGERRLAFQVWALALLAGLGLDLASGGAVSGRIAQTLLDPLVGQRFLLTRAGVLMFLAHPLVGMGPGGFEAGLDEFGLLVPGLSNFVGSAHNTYVHVAAELGSVGFLALVGFFASTWWILRSSALRFSPERSRRSRVTSTLFWSFTVACAISFAEWAFAHGVGQLIMLVAAMGFALDAEASQ